jgi:hypothetical protein
VEYDCLGYVPDLAVGSQQAITHVVVLGGAEPRTRSEPFIETTESQHDVAVERHVRPRHGVPGLSAPVDGGRGSRHERRGRYDGAPRFGGAREHTSGRDRSRTADAQPAHENL